MLANTISGPRCTSEATPMGMVTIADGLESGQVHSFLPFMAAKELRRLEDLWRRLRHQP